MQKLLSIIIPVYNVEKYLIRCLDSVIHQSFKDFEVILIDDGSSDRSGDICDEYAKMDSRVRVIHQENAGTSAAKNIALKCVEGKYLGFVDADDWIDWDMYSLLINDAESNDADISLCGIVLDYEDGKSKLFSDLEIFQKMNSQKAIQFMLEHKIFGGYLWNRIYKRELFAKLQFDETIFVCEDLLISWYLFHRAKNITFNSDSKYHYFQRKDSICNQKFSLKKITAITALKEIHYATQKYYPELSYLTLYRYKSSVIGYTTSILSEGIGGKVKFLEMQIHLKEDFKNYYDNGFTSLWQKILSVILLFPFWFCRILGVIFFKPLKYFRRKF